MSTYPKVDPMTGSFCITVNDFGPIEYAAVDLKPFTIFVGQGNTGKTHLATLIYALHNELHGIPRLPYSNLRSTNLDSYDQNIVIEDLINFFSKLEPKTSTDPKHLSVKNLPPIFRDTMFTSSNQKTEFSKNLTESIAHTFGVKKYSNLCRSANTSAGFKLEFCYSEDSNVLWKYKLNAEKNNISSESLLNEETLVQFESLEDINTELANIKNKLMDHQNQLKASVSRQVNDIYNMFDLKEVFYLISGSTSNLTYSAYYFPAERCGILQSYKLIASRLLDRYPFVEINRRDLTPSIPTTTVRLITWLLYLDEWYSKNPDGTSDHQPPFRKSIWNAIDGLEERVLGGKIGMTREPNTTFSKFHFTPNGSSISYNLNQTGSMVSELAPIAFLIKEYVNPHDLVIIEEPEAHLHASAQVEIANSLAQLVRSNVRVIVTTHSEWFLKCIENLVSKGDLTGLRENDKREAASVFLHRDEVGVWEFIAGKGQSGTKVKRVEIHEERGAIPEDLVRLNLALYNELASISDKISIESAQFTLRDVADRLNVDVEWVNRELKKRGYELDDGDQQSLDFYTYEELCGSLGKLAGSEGISRN